MRRRNGVDCDDAARLPRNEGQMHAIPTTESQQQGTKLIGIKVTFLEGCGTDRLCDTRKTILEGGSAALWGGCGAAEPVITVICR